MVTNIYGDAERVRSGSALPKFYGGFNNTLTYKNFDFSFYFYFSYGALVYNSDYATNMHDGSNTGYNLAADALNAWSPNNRYTDVPKYISNNTTRSNASSSRFLEDASYLRLKNISIGYSLPAPFLEKIKIQTFRLFISAENIWTLTGYKGFDPEQSINGTTGNTIPGVKTVSFGIKLDL